MRVELLLTIIIGGAVLIAYSWIEKRINQKTCTACGFSVSREAVEEACPRCAAKFPSSRYAKDFE